MRVERVSKLEVTKKHVVGYIKSFNAWNDMTEPLAMTCERYMTPLGLCTFKQTKTPKHNGSHF